MLRERVKEVLTHQNMIPPKAGVLLGVSGGVDSMTLLEILCGLREEMGFSLGAAHVDHGIREDSAEDAALVSKYCREHGIAYYQKNLSLNGNLPKGENLEDYARRMRYEYFSMLMEQENYEMLMTAHHADDQAETILMHLIRGCGMRGLCGMQPKRGRVCRPMLQISKEEIRSYAKEQGIPYREDSTNCSGEYTRNRIRRELIPQLKTYNPNIVEALGRMAEQTAQDADYLDELGRNAYEKLKKYEKDGVILLDFPGMLLQNPAIQYRIFKCALLALDGTDIDADMIARCVQAVNSHKRTDVGREILVQAKDGRIAVYRQKEYPERLRVPIPGRVAFQSLKICMAVSECAPDEAKSRLSEKAQAFDAEVLEEYLPLTLRTRRAGDRFVPFGGGTKSLSDYMTDEKIPTALRDRILVLASGDQVLWVLGYRRGDAAKITENTRRAVLFEYKAFF